MRHTPLFSLLVFSVIGFSGCVSATKRMDWPPARQDDTDAAETPARPSLSSSPRPRSEAPAAESDAPVAQTNRPATPAGSNATKGDAWPESRSDWLARRFPHLSRFWNGGSAESLPHDADGVDVIRITSRTQTAAPSHRTREDVDVRPVDASADDTAASPDGSAAAGKRERFVPPLVPTPLLVPSNSDSKPHSPGEVEPDSTTVDARWRSRARSDELESPLTQRERALSTSDDAAPITARAPVDALRNEPLVAASTDRGPVVTPESTDDAEPEFELTQAPAAPAPSTQPPSAVPPPPPLDRAPPPPPISGEEKPAAKPAQPAQPTTPTTNEAKPDQAQEATPPPAQQPTPAAAPPPATPPSPPVATAPEPAQAPAAEAPAPAAPPVPQNARTIVTGSAQSIYASRPPMAPPQPRRRFLSLFFIEEKTEPLAPPQFPPATYPASYYVGQGAQGPKPYPAFAAPQTVAVTPTVATHATPQTVAVTPTVATHAEKKPCVLTVWLQKLKSCGKGLGCGGCHHGGSVPCCAGCTCHVGKTKPATASPQAATFASPQGAAGSRPAFSSQDPPIGSAGTQPGNVTEEWKLFERVSFDSFDKSPKS
jgi:hypothetical protein